MGEYTIDLPAPFEGTAAERAANQGSHSWSRWDRDEPPMCDRCGCKSWHVAASWPCGAQVPRLRRTFPTPE